jgi:glycosyltransferase involved in cell wall biosynthesis
MKISVLTTSFNSGKTIEATIKSVVRQKHKNIEYIVIDGGSTDETNTIIKKYKNNISKFISEKDNGMYDAMNKGIKFSSGDVVCILNSDDIFADSNILSLISESFINNPNVSAVLCDVGHCKNNSNLAKPHRLVSAKYFSPWKMRFGFNPPHPGLFLRKSVYNNYGLFREDFKSGADIEFMVRLFCKEKINFLKLGICSVMMRDGGVSTRGWSSFHQNTKEMVRSCNVNNIKTSYFIIIMRLPIKWFSQKIFFNIKNLIIKLLK